MKWTEVGLDGWCEGGLGQQRNDGMRDNARMIGKTGDPWCTVYVTD